MNESIKMKMKNKAVYITAVFAVFILGSGCISTITPNFTVSSAATGNGKASKIITYNFRRTSRCSTSADFDKDICNASGLNGAWVVPQDESVAISQFRKAFSHRATEIRCFANETNIEYDICMDIMQQNSWNGLCLFAAQFSGFTLTLVPCWGDDAYTLYVEASSKRGLKRTYQLTSTLTTITWAPFILAMPIVGMPTTHANEMTEAHWSELLRRMERDGFFDE